MPIQVKTVSCKGFQDQNPGTSGLRKKVKIFQQENYVETYIQSMFNTLKIKGKAIVVGGDGRYYNKEVLQKILSMAAANNVGKVFVAQDGLLSTPASSNFIRKNELDYGIILSASHNPAGPEGDFGIKLNTSNGAPAGVTITDLIFKDTTEIGFFNILEEFSLDVTKVQETRILNTVFKVFNPVEDYVALMESIFDFQLIKDYIQSGKIKFFFNSLYGVTAPYALEIFVNKLGVAKEYLVKAEVKEDFGKLVPDPNPVSAKDFVQLVKDSKEVDLGFACDADGDRNFIFSKKNFLEPSDSLAILLEYAHLIPYYQNKLTGVARSKATSYAIDLVAKAKGLNCHVVPTGWKYFSNLLDSNTITLCGEESFGTGSIHMREKDGIWAILFWLNIMAKTNLSLDSIINKLWQDYGRVYFSRYDFENLDNEVATKVDAALENVDLFINKKLSSGYILQATSNFSYKDATDNIKVSNQGLVLTFNNNAEIIIRKSGTSTSGVIIRAYLHHYEGNSNKLYEDKHKYLQNLGNALFEILGINIKPTAII